MDDLLLLDRDPEKLKTMIEPIDQWLQTHRKQRLNPEKTKLTCLSEGINYLGFKLRQTDSPAEPLQAFAEPKKKWAFIKALKKLENQSITVFERPHVLSLALQNNKLERETASINSRVGALGHSNTFHFREKALCGSFERNTPQSHILLKPTAFNRETNVKTEYWV